MRIHSWLYVALVILPVTSACSPVGYIVGGIVFASQGSSGSSSRRGEPTPVLSISLGANSPGSAQALTVEADVEVLQVTLAATGQDIQISSVRFAASGSGHDVNGIQAIRLYRDDDGDGSLVPTATFLTDVPSFSGDDGSSTVVLSETVLAGTQVDWLLVYDLGAGPNAGESFCAVLGDSTDVTADAGGQTPQIHVDPGIQGCVSTIRTGCNSRIPFTPSSSVV